MSSQSITIERPRSPALLATTTLAESVVILLALTGIQRLVGFARGILFCRWLEPEQLGQWDIAFGFLMLAAPLAVCGLPGSFGRYAEYFRQRGQLRLFLRRVTLATVALATTAVVIVLLARDRFSQLLFGHGDETAFVALLAVCLIAVIAYNFFTSLLIALRLYRLVSILQMLQSVGFATVGIALVCAWSNSSTSVVVAFGVSCLFCSLVAIYCMRSYAAEQHSANEKPDGSPFWAKLLPFAAWMWITNLLAGLFEVADRYMIMHYSGLDTTTALTMVGQYHSSRVVPLLFVAVAGLLGAMITPHLSQDWEAGRRGDVSARLNLILKLWGLALGIGAVLVMLAAPLLFGVAFAGKYDSGLAVLPWTLTYCVWFSLFTVAANYLWCAEKAGWASAALLVGLTVNIVLNHLLLPSYGLFGAVIGTTSANFVALALIYALSRRRGMRIEPGMLVISALPLTFCLGTWPAAAALCGVIALALVGDLIINADEKRQIARIIQQALARFHRSTHVDAISVTN